MSLFDIAKSRYIVKGPAENSRPINVRSIFILKQPETFYPNIGIVLV